MSLPLLQVKALVRRYPRPRMLPWRRPDDVVALRGVSLEVEAGSSLGIVGESGSGKSTLARLVMALERPDGGHVLFQGRDLNALPPAALRALRRHFQMIFQDPYGSLDPRQTIARIVAEPLAAVQEDKAASDDLVSETLESVGLRRGDGTKYPHEFSGGQRQRIAIARALITRPRLIVADEPVSALDVSVQAQVLNLLRDLAMRHDVTYLLISHDLAVVDYVTERLAVMYRGAVVEAGATAAILAAPRHPYTKALKDAVPGLVAGRRRRGRRGTIVARATEGGEPGCPYAGSCSLALAICRAEAPVLREVAAGHHAACHLA
ncbi:MAG TPA: oligopeptide/dipeptide ABC transporter ATP-binding protein [Stellaceae bacterium]|nr:oligopeptide/dipeptide ABC transporter ATP-binding protein [Stellaceae bacterium]